MQRERRREARHWSDEKMRVLSSTDPIRTCTLIEMSPSGARLLFDDEPPSADNLLLISEADCDVHVGAVRWRLGKTIGIEYVREADDLSE